MKTVKFQLYGTVAQVKTQFDLVENSPVNEDDTSRCAILATIIGRRGNGKNKGVVFTAAGISICHPTDMYSEEIGTKLAVLDAVESLYWQDAIAQRCFSLEEYQHIWWSAYQRAVHGRPEEVDPPHLGFELTFI
jgi:hypothetical protein